MRLRPGIRWVTGRLAPTACLFLALLFVGCGSAHADVLVGPNGERLPGHLIGEKNGVLIFQSDFLGRIEVPANRAHVERDTPVARDAETAKPATEAAPAQARPTTEVASAQATSAKDAASTQAEPHWMSDLATKLNADRGSLKVPENVVDASWNIDRHMADSELNASVSYKYKRSNGKLQNNDWLGSVGLDRFLSAQHFMSGRLLGQSELQNNGADQGYDKTATATAAWGWRLWEAPGRYMRIGPAVGFLSMHRSGGTFNGPALGLYVHAKYPTWRKATIEGELQFLDASAGNRYMILQLRLKRPLTERLYIALDWLYTDSQVEVETGIISQWRWVIGWNFDSYDNKKP